MYLRDMCLPTEPEKSTRTYLTYLCRAGERNHPPGRHWIGGGGASYVPPIEPMLDSLGSIKKGQKIRKGMNQTKSKDIALAKLHTTIY
jgi:hypothetical protein